MQDCGPGDRIQAMGRREPAGSKSPEEKGNDNVKVRSRANAETHT